MQDRNSPTWPDHVEVLTTSPWIPGIGVTAELFWFHDNGYFEELGHRQYYHQQELESEKNHDKNQQFVDSY